MKLLVLSLNYAPEPTGFAPHTTALCEYLTSQEHEVTVLTGFPFAPYWARWPEYGKQWFRHERVHNVSLWRLSHFVPHRPGQFLQRILMEGSFCGMALLLLIGKLRAAVREFDGVVYIGAQPSLAMLTRGIARWCGLPYVVKITDLAAQAATDVGIVRSRWLMRLLAKFEYAAYTQASGAIVLCEGFQEALLSRHYPLEQIRIIRGDSVNLDLIYPTPDSARFRHTANLTAEDFVVLYSGSMGLKQGLTNVVHAVQLLKDEYPHIKWVFVGDGELKPVLQQLIAERNLSAQIRLLPLQPEAEMAAMLSSANILLLNQLQSVKDTVIPSKLLMYMASGRPVLAAVNARSQGAALLGDAQGGILVAPEDPSALAQAVQQVYDDQATLGDMGQRNRCYAEAHFDQRKIVVAQEEFLAQVFNQAS